MTSDVHARCVSLDEVARARDGRFGGKAHGLARLEALGLRVPAAFVVAGASADVLPPELYTHYEALGGEVAVRSSAVGEDGAEASFAGQFESVLGVRDAAGLVDALGRCFASVTSARADAYRTERAETGHGITMNVVVQRMVDARAAGVTFTIDPSSGRRDHLVIDAVTGLGEALVAGEASADHYVVRPDGTLAARECVGDAPVLDDALVARIAAEAREAAGKFGMPLDLEWAVDRDGVVWWLQARPITRLLADPRELDTVPADDDVWTRANVGEMMPGAVTPLTLSVSGRGIDVGIQRLYRGVGVYDREGAPLGVFVASFGNHLFLNLMRLVDLSCHLFGAPPAHMGLAICGRPVPELEHRALAPFGKRVVTMARYIWMLARIPKARARLEGMVARTRVPDEGTASAQWKAIDAMLPELFVAYELHLQSSSGAGAVSPALLDMIRGKREATMEDHARVGALLAGATDVESADIAVGADAIVDALARTPDVAARFMDVDPEAALAFLRSPDAGEAGDLFRRYLDKHGHRAVREAELRQKEWREDPLPVVRSLRAGLKRRARSDAHAETPIAIPLDTLPRALRFVVGLGRDAVRSRERTKSLLIAMTTSFKVAYRRLAQRLIEEGTIADADLVYFFTHEELGALCAHPSDAAIARAEARRRVLPVQANLAFEEVFVGVPEPLVQTALSDDDAVVVGRPVSPGEVRGRVRVAFTIEDAALLEPGEILVTPITDVGWTPYFSVIAGLATDVGSAVSHGAVVAREYGMPAVVGLRDATRRFRTGDTVVLDGTRGTLRRVCDLDP